MRSRQVVRPLLSAALAVAFLTAPAASSSAQSLGDVARREGERRKQVASGKVYTDNDLPPVDASAPPPPETSLESGAKSTGGAEDTAQPPSEPPPTTDSGTAPTNLRGREKRDEQYWKARVGEIQARIAKATSEVAAKEARIAELDESPQTPKRLQEREVVAASLTQLRRDVRYLGEELTRIKARAQKEGVPDAWVR